MNDNKPDILLVSFDASPKNGAILIVGRKNQEGIVNILNAFQGEKALCLYDKLSAKKGE